MHRGVLGLMPDIPQDGNKGLGFVALVPLNPSVRKLPVPSTKKKR